MTTTMKKSEVHSPSTRTRTMRAVQVSSVGGALELVDRPIPEPQPEQVRIKVQACGVCGSDSMIREGMLPIAYPRVPGHEVIGSIDVVGQGVRNWMAGQRVGLGWHGGHCFVCDACRRGDFIHCVHEQVPGISYDGGYAEYVVAPQEALARVPDELQAIEAAPLMCAGVTTFNALRHSGARAGDVVAVLGVGGLGHLGIQFAHHLGFKTVAIEPGKDKERLARSLGADLYVDAEVQDPARELQALGGARVVLATAPSGKAMAAVLGGLGIGGQVLVIGIAREPLEVPATSLLLGSHSLLGWYCGIATDSEDTMRFSVLRDVRPMIETFPLERAAEAYARMMAGQVHFRAVLVP